MSFVELLKSDKNNLTSEDYNMLNVSKVMESQSKKPEEILRDAGFKIKLITRTSFGVQIDFAKKYDDDDINNVLKAYSIKIKGKSVFIVE